jgi:very-short-patch-repair endonuclease
MMEKLIITVDAAARLNLALLQNNIPPIRSIEIDNLNEKPIENIKIKYHSDPAGFLKGEVTIATINHGEIFRVEVPSVSHSWDLFKNVQERIVGVLHISVIDGAGNTLIEKTHAFTIEPETVWLGQKAPLELLASHIMPNTTAVQKVLRTASELVKEKTGRSALDGYQSKSKERIYDLAQAVFLALRKEGITYISPPASFEKTGQKVRTPNQIISDRMGTCLDLTLLYLACLEQVGLHSIAFIVDGHAFAGFWLEDKYLPRATEEDPQLYRKLIELQEIIALDITAMTSDNPVRFSDMEQRAQGYLKNEDEFICGIDIAHARKIARINPLNAFDSKISEAPEVKTGEESQTFEERKFDDFKISDEAVKREGEVEKWKDKLLDLSFRNKLLNFRPNKGTIEIFCKDVAQMEDILSGGAKFEILPQTNQSALTASRTDLQEILSDQIDEGFSRNQLLTKIPEERFATILNGIFRSVVNSEEETGSNTLYLALGILCWRETEGSSVIRRSPILMVPVNLSKGRGNKYKLSMRDDDSVLNMTLLQKLKRDFDLDFPGLDPLPEDESGTDVKKVLDTFRQVVRDIRGWEVKEEVWLGEFSFQKFLMWKELNDHLEEMLESPVTRRIMTGEVPSDFPAFVTESEVEKIVHPKEVYCPLSADSSQMAAILSAANGSSFVLQGPPGTGKSQTIANMIAHCLGMGKRVLFVSEKKVALEVVYKRLQEIGLGDFCLELHSKKSEKKAVVQSFYSSLEHATPDMKEEWGQVSDVLKSSRDKLSDYFHALHEKSRVGVSAYQAFGTSPRDADTLSVDLTIDDFLVLDPSRLHEIKTQLTKWVDYANSLNDEAFSIWNHVHAKDWSSVAEDDMVSTIKGIESAAASVAQCKAGGQIKFPMQDQWLLKDWRAFKKLLGDLLNIGPVVIAFDQVNDVQLFKADYLTHLDKLKKHHTLGEKLSGIFQNELTAIDYSGLKEELENSQKGFVLLQWIKKNKLRKKLKNILKEDLRNLEEYDPIFSDGVVYKQAIPSANEAADFIIGHSGQAYSIEKDIQFRNALTWFENLHEALLGLYSGDMDVYARAKANAAELLKTPEILRSSNSAYRKVVESVIQALDGLFKSIDKLETSLELHPEFFECTLSEFRNKTEVLQRNASCFRDVAAMNTIRHSLCSKGLATLFDAVKQGKVARKEIEIVFNYNFHRQWLASKQAESQELNNTTGTQLELNDAEYKQTDETYRELTQKALSAKLSVNKPKLGGFIVPSSPTGIIVNQNNRSRGHMPIRKFLKKIDSVAGLLKPCYLMSPMSVSQYLPVSPDFDVVIFDEASQIPPWDAVGSISRGQQAIIVGDNKQLPPTAFFSNQGDGDSDEMVDCESVLEMFGSMFPEMLLKWHYRSRSESLISFSNYHIYDNRLHTFPSAETDDNKVSLQIVTGDEAYYDRSRSRTNSGEGKAVVEEIFKRLRSGASSSIGVVTFSSAQATLISDLIDAQLLLEPQFEQAFDVSEPEYVFVKNLENVQGDERDLILFSIGYGKDATGRINKNFGPLNNSGGERRLNVAVTRAKCEVKIFSNFHPREFDVTTSSSEGLRLLKEYLLYAEGGRASLIRQVRSNEADEFDSVFEEQVARRLRAKGWEVRTQVGVGGYRIDLGVIHPQYAGSYLAGIECDGARYHSAKTARDRDILRQMVLEGLGWNILRIWSTDWWYNSQACIDKIDAELRRLLIEPQNNEEQVKADSQNKEDEFTDAESDDRADDSEMDLEPDILVFDVSKVSLTCYGDFYVSRGLVKQQIAEVVDALAPISRDECFTIVARAWNFARRGRRIDAYLDICSDDIHKTRAGDHIYYWKTAEQVNSLDHFRKPADGAKRDAISVAPEELWFAFLPILQANIQIQKTDLFREVAKVLGGQALTKRVIEDLEPGLKYLEEQNWVEIKDDIVLFNR